MTHFLEREVGPTARSGTARHRRPANPLELSPTRASGSRLGVKYLLALQRSAGNRAVSALYESTVQRCGPIPCNCAEEQQEATKKPVDIATVSRTVALQRDNKPPKPPAPKRDIAVVLSSSQALDRKAFAVEASSLTTAPPIPAPTPEDLIKILKTLPLDIGRLFIIGHSGDIVGGVKPEGKLIFAGGKSITLDKLAAGVGSATGGHPTSLEFRGCRIGSGVAGLDALRKAVGAATASGSSCFVFAAVTNSPVTLTRFNAKGKVIAKIPITNPAQLKDPAVKAAFDAEFEKQIRAQLDAFKCIIGIPKGLTGPARTQALKDLYFRNKGQLEAKWVRDDGKARFDANDPCFEDLTKVPQKGCSLVVVPSGGGGGGGGKKACVPADRTAIVAAAFEQAALPEPAVDPDLVDLRRGDGISVAQDRKPRVEKLQGRLADEGFGLDQDGKFGAKTNEAVNAVQDSADLPQTQVVDILTATVLAADGSQIVGLTQGDGLNPATVGRRRRVKRLQELLTEHGSATRLDGKFGPRTLEALNNFQESLLLAPSAVVDAVTADILEGRRTPPEPVCDDNIPIGD